MRSSNPALSEDTFTHFGYRMAAAEAMTVQGTMIKTALMLLCLLLSAGYTWSLFIKSHGNVAAVTPWMWGGAIGGFVAALVTIFKKEWAAVTAPIYALLEGFFIGGLSSLLEASFPGIVIQATALTFGTMAAMLAVYQSGIIDVNDRFRFGVAAATGGIVLVYFGAILLGFFGISLPIVYGSGWLGILFSLLVVGVAALNLILDFDFIDKGSRLGVPKYMEWYGAFALMVTLIWLYIEMLRLLAKLRER